MWEWLQGLSGGAGTLIGSLTGSLVGLIALLIGALFNAHLNRQRDDRLRKEETRALAAALRAELAGICRTLEENAKSLRNPKADFHVPDLSHSVRLFPEVLSKLGFLDIDTIRRVSDAYILIDQYCEQLLLRGGEAAERLPNRRAVLMPKHAATFVADTNERYAKALHEATESLDKYLY